MKNYTVKSTFEKHFCHKNMHYTKFLCVFVTSNSNACANQCPRYWPSLKEVEKQSLHGFAWAAYCFVFKVTVSYEPARLGVRSSWASLLAGLCHSLCINSSSTCMLAESISDNLENQMMVSGETPAQDLLQSRCSLKCLWSSASWWCQSLRSFRENQATCVSRLVLLFKSWHILLRSSDVYSPE